MRKNLLWIILAVLAAASLASCNTLNAAPTPTVQGPSISDFPRPGHVSDYLKLSDGLLTFGTDMSLGDIMAFYRTTLTKEGYSERTKLTFTSDTAFGLVFDGYPGGREIVIQGAIVGNASTVTVRLLDVDTNQQP